MCRAAIRHALQSIRFLNYYTEFWFSDARGYVRLQGLNKVDMHV